IRFWPSSATFTQIEFDRATIEHRLRELAFLNSGLHVKLIDARIDLAYENDLKYIGGLKEFGRYINKGKKPLHDPSIYMHGEKDNMKHNHKRLLN
ncbi:MAG: hypothetical protein ACKO96_23415, partial [Flammeovirgaceae bacterium]